MKPNCVMLHCSATPDSGDKIGVKEIDREHRKQGWIKVGYHWVIRRSGLAERGREDTMQGAHVEGHNQDSLAVCYVGTSKPTFEQIKTIVKIFIDYKVKFEIGWENWRGHYEFVNFDNDPHNNKLCPGFDMNLFRYLLANVDAYPTSNELDSHIENFLKIIEGNKFHGRRA